MALSLSFNFAERSEAADTTMNLTIEGGTVTAYAPVTMDFGTATVSSTDVVKTLTEADAGYASGGTGSGEYFRVDDMEGGDVSGWYTTLQSSNLTTDDGATPEEVITAANVAAQRNAGTISVLSGTANPAVTYDLSATYVTLDSARTIMTHDGTENNITGLYGVQPEFQLTVPAYRAVGAYTGTLTYTLVNS